MPLLRLGAKPAQAAAVEAPSVLPLAVKEAVAEVAKATPAYTGGRPKAADAMSKADWAEKDTRISRQGLYQAALQSVGAMQFGASASLEDYLLLVRKVAEDGLKFVSEGK